MIERYYLKVRLFFIFIIFIFSFCQEECPELKVCKGNKIRFSPHQIAFHVKHPQNTFIIAEALGPRSEKLIHMYSGSRIMELEACGLKLDPLCLGLEACGLWLNRLGA